MVHKQKQLNELRGIPGEDLALPVIPMALGFYKSVLNLMKICTVGIYDPLNTMALSVLGSAPFPASHAHFQSKN